MRSRRLLALTVVAAVAAVVTAVIHADVAASMQSSSTSKQQVIDLLKSIETGAPGPVAVINPTEVHPAQSGGSRRSGWVR